MSKINIDGQDYELEALSTIAKEQIQSMQIVDAELARIAAQQAIFQTARNAYFLALKKELAVTSPKASGGDSPLLTQDTIRFS